MDEESCMLRTSEQLSWWIRLHKDVSGALLPSFGSVMEPAARDDITDPCRVGTVVLVHGIERKLELQDLAFLDLIRLDGLDPVGTGVLPRSGEATTGFPPPNGSASSGVASSSKLWML